MILVSWLIGEEASLRKLWGAEQGLGGEAGTWEVECTAVVVDMIVLVTHGITTPKERPFCPPVFYKTHAIVT